MTTTSAPAPSTATHDPSEYRRVLTSSFVGSAVEFYDFLLYGTAASLVFGPLFVSGQPETVALMASFATFAVGYLARPLGGVIFGQMGDRVGRKATLVTTMLIMGIASTLVGLLPTSAQIGALAPVLLIILRVLQGVAVGGEWGGAALMALEHSPTHLRGFSASFANMGGPAGAVLATIVFALATTLPEDDFLSWGWRVPFLISAALVGIGLFIRLRVTESPIFLKAQEQDRAKRTHRLAIADVLRRYPRELALAATATIAALSLQTFMATFAISMARESGLSSTLALVFHGLAAFLHIFTIPFFAHLSDRVGRRRVITAGAVALIVMAVPLIWLLSSGQPTLVLLGMLLGNPILQATMYGPLAAYVSEMFGTSTRYTGAGVGYQLGATLGGGFTPLIAASLWSVGQDTFGQDWTQYLPVATPPPPTTSCGWRTAATCCCTRRSTWRGWRSSTRPSASARSATHASTTTGARTPRSSTPGGSRRRRRWAPSPCTTSCPERVRAGGRAPRRPSAAG